MFIEDDELRELYKVASTDHIEKIETGLLHLEKHPNDKAKLDELLRATHSLKGDSRMLGVEEAEMLVHQMEDLLNEVKDSQSLVSDNLCDRLYHGIDAVRKIAREAVTGEPSGVSVFHVIAQLMGAEAEAEPESLAFEETSDKTTVAVDKTLQDETIQEVKDNTILNTVFNKDNTVFNTVSNVEEIFGANSNSSSPETPNKAYTQEHQIDTVRVDFNKLDTLMDQAGELLATKMRLARRNYDVAQMFQLWEDWSRNLSLNQTLFQELEPRLTPEELEPLQKYEQINQQYLEQLGDFVTKLQNIVVEDNARLESVTNDLESGIRNLRVVPLSNIFNLFPRMVRDLGKQLNKKIDFQIEGGDTAVDKRILEAIKDPLTHIIRNAIDHGLETPEERALAGKPPTASLTLRGYQKGNNIVIESIDDGRGLDIAKIKATAIRRCAYTEAELENMKDSQIQSLIFAPGFSTRTEVSQISGRGVGLDVVRANVERLKGSIQVESIPDKGCKFQIILPTSLSTTQVLLVDVNKTPYALPIDFIDKMILVAKTDIFLLEGTPTISWNDEPLSVVWLADLLGLPSKQSDSLGKQTIPCVILKVDSERLGVFVDGFFDQQNIILKPQSKLLQKIPNISGATILSGGDICMVLNPKDLVLTATQGTGFAGERPQIVTKAPVKPKVLLVEDSPPIRTQVKRILEGSGYDVTVAVDGLEGFKTIRAGKAFDAVVSDVEMPNLSGLEMTARIREYPEYEELPIILVTTLAKEADKRRGVEAGANAYLTKGDFDQNLLLNTLERLI
ncbi:MAG: hybrid sensor histidine kinase/response regulator [Xenococcaceae cyanobacterium MO_234.B1]|nr:hybrid sensor histidine kinase/response regulator [Xenococcaceae cyanobacterium MO_234.B1]